MPPYALPSATHSPECILSTPAVDPCSFRHLSQKEFWISSSMALSTFSLGKQAEVAPTSPTVCGSPLTETASSAGMTATGAFLPPLKGSRPCSPHAARQSPCCHTAPFSQRTTVTSSIRTPARAATGTDAAEPANLSMHPDALRRRQEAAARFVT